MSFHLTQSSHRVNLRHTETSEVPIPLNLAVLGRGFRRPIEMVMSACRPAQGYPL